MTIGTGVASKRYHPFGEATSDAAYRMCEDLEAKGIVAHTTTGQTALYLSKSRPLLQ